MTSPYRRRQGGLMRCCLLILDDHMAARQEKDGPVPTGTTLKCSYCWSSMVMAEDGAWEWLRPGGAPEQKRRDA